MVTFASRPSITLEANVSLSRDQTFRGARQASHRYSYKKKKLKKKVTKKKMPYYKTYTPYARAFKALAGGVGIYGGTRTANRYRYRSGGTQTLVNTKRKPRRSSNSFQAQLMRAQPAKHYIQSSTTSLLHNTVYTVVPTAGITQGDADSNRDGDYVHLAAIKIKGFFETATAENAYSYRVMVGYTGEEYNLPTVLGTSGLGVTEVFLPNTYNNWYVNGIINSKAFTCVYDETIDINSQLAGVKDIKSYAFTVQLDKRFPYQSNGSIYGKNTNLVVLVVSSVSGGVSGTTSAGSTVLAYDLIFKDI